MQIKKKYFGTDGIRGRANSSKMNAELALKIGMASAKIFTRGTHRHHVLIGKDTRLSNYTIEPSLVAGFLSMGMNVYLTGPLPTPGVSALVSSLRCDVGVMISASHNQYQDNGIKIFGPDGSKLSDQQELQIEKFIDDKNITLVQAEDLGRAQRIDDAGGRYIEHLKSKISSTMRLDGLKIVIDCANGASYKVAPTILWELGAEIIPINVNPDGTNVNKKCGSTDPKKLIKEVKKNKADIGIALDGDADRCLIVDEKSNIIDGDKILAMIAIHWKKCGRLSNSSVVGTVMSNKALENYLSSQKIKLIRTQVGDRNIIQQMKKKKYVLGGEPSGHLILDHYASTGDGILASLEILAMMKLYNKKLSSLANLYKPFPQIIENLLISNHEINDKTILKLEDRISKIRREMDNQSRLIIRKSGTENKIRIMAEANTNNMAKKIVKRSLTIIKEYVNEI